MRCVVTGGAGFIGSWLCGSLLEKGHDVVCVDNFLSGSKRNVSRKEIEVVDADVSKRLEVRGNIDAVFHLASLASPKFYKLMPIETMMANSLGTFNALKLAKDCKARFLYASSSEVYGDPKEHPQKESYFGNVNPIGERSCYDEAKRFGEALVYSFSQKHDLSSCIVRIFNTYGPRMRRDDGRVVPNFIMQAIRNEDITIYGDGNQTRSFCYASDLIEGICATTFSGHNDVFNLGNTQEIKIRQLAEMIKEKTGSSSKIVYKGIGGDDPVRRRPDITKAMAMLKWEPEVTLNEGLDTTIKWFRDE